MNSITINVGGRRFTTLRSTLTGQSSFFAGLLSGAWPEQACQINGEPFVDANPDLFDHVLNYLRRSFPPIFWTRAGGFDLSLYAAVLREAEYFGVATLAEWIREKKYIYTVRITSSIEVEQLSDCKRDLRPFWGDTEKGFEPGTLSTSSNSGKSTTQWKRLLVQKIELCTPVRLLVILS
jgi:hypothetical protein